MAEYVLDCTTSEIVIDSMGDSPLISGIVYWIGVVASDDWGNEDLDDVLGKFESCGRELGLI